MQNKRHSTALQESIYYKAGQETHSIGRLTQRVPTLLEFLLLILLDHFNKECTQKFIFFGRSIRSTMLIAAVKSAFHLVINNTAGYICGMSCRSFSGLYFSNSIHYYIWLFRLFFSLFLFFFVCFFTFSILTVLLGIVFSLSTYFLVLVDVLALTFFVAVVESYLGLRLASLSTFLELMSLPFPD
jgi:hypothetical protein